MVAGFVNVILLAPVWMQIIHLLLADIMWIAAILLGATALTQAETEPQMTQIPQIGSYNL